MLESQPSSALPDFASLQKSLAVSSAERVRLPEPPKDSLHSTGMLRHDELFALITALSDRIVDSAVAVVQSGNRYIYEYLTRQFTLPVCNIKATSLAKCQPHKTLNSLLTSQERRASLPKKSIDELHAVYSELPSEDRRCINSECRSSFGDIGKLFRYCTTGDVIRALCNVRLQLPFREPTYGVTRLQEMIATLEQIRAGRSLLCTDHMLSVILARCTLARRLGSSSTVAIVDHVIYRGRTLFSIAWIMSLLQIKSWSFYALCADSLASSILWYRTTILAPGRLYPYENSVSSEGGYWDETESHFAFRDLRKYHCFLHRSLASVAVSQHFSEVISRWQLIIAEIDELLPLPLMDREFRLALIAVLIRLKSRGRGIQVTALQNQRASNVGYCAHWATFCERYMCQAFDLNVRELFNRDVAISAGVIDRCLSRTGAELGAKAIQFYTDHSQLIDYFALHSLFYQKP